MDLNRNKVIDIQLVQKNVVGGSYHMELEGLKLGVAAIGMEQLKIQALVTDRHAQVAKWIRENLKDIQHYYDVWHVAKSLGKRVRAIGKEKDCEVVQEWARSINNHVYWVASSTPSGDPNEMLGKFMSLKNHIQNIHTGHSEHFPNCLHPPIQERNRKKWLKPGSKACKKLSDLLEKRHFLKDIQKLSPHRQTSGVEAFHGTIIHFAPKMLVYSYNGMFTR
ncbi:uncharacterized protein LOC117117029 [Anneissia japonica]|uniref:uncharacterized protein LOC117117029 n=1 Tax=Anneissia japonica TaxID=1529436 RepID=UPI00142571E8|nr:uncharacterized protein LOC117117029 [Anneissia japonica]